MDQEAWYYDPLPRVDADRMVKLDGDYLVRFSDTKGYVLTTKWEGQPRHFVIQKLEEEVLTHYTFDIPFIMFFRVALRTVLREQLFLPSATS